MYTAVSHCLAIILGNAHVDEFVRYVRFERQKTIYFFFIVYNGFVVSLFVPSTSYRRKIVS